MLKQKRKKKTKHLTILKRKQGICREYVHWFIINLPMLYACKRRLSQKAGSTAHFSISQIQEFENGAFDISFLNTLFYRFTHLSI